MDGGFRSPRPVERRSASRPEPARRQPEEPQSIVNEPPKAVRHTGAPRHAVKAEKSTFKRFLWPLIVLLIAAVAVGVWFMWSGGKNGSMAIDGSKYQAVFFTNGQVYFGKLSTLNDGYLKLTDIYYLQSQQSTADKSSSNPQETSTDQSNVQLIKLGDEIHGPEDQMVISKEQVLFYENLKTDGKVAQSIQKFKDSK